MSRTPYPLAPVNARSRGLACCALLLALPLAAVAGDRPEERPAPDPRFALGPSRERVDDPSAPRIALESGRQLTRPGSDLFYAGHFLPRISRQLDPLQSLGLDPRIDGLDDVFEREADRAIRRSVTRATRKAVRDYLLETTAIERRFELWHQRSRTEVADGSVSEGARRERLRVDLGFHGIHPRLEMRYDLAGDAYRLRLGAEGDVGLTYRHGRAQNVELLAGVDRKQTYRLGFRFGF